MSLGVTKSSIWNTKMAQKKAKKVEKRRPLKALGQTRTIIKMKRKFLVKRYKSISDWNKKLTYWYGYIPRKTYKRIKARITIEKPFFTWMERRLEVVVVRMHLARSIREARQLIRHGHILVNGKKQRRPGTFVPVGAYVESKHPLRYIMRYTFLSFKENYGMGDHGRPEYIRRLGLESGLFLRHPRSQEVLLPRWPDFPNYLLSKSSKIK